MDAQNSASPASSGPEAHADPDDVALPLAEALLATLRTHREAVLWKARGLREWDLRRPLTPTGTNILGLIKHLATMEYEYMGSCLGREHEDLPWVALIDSGEDMDADTYALPAESSAELLALYRRAGEFTEEAIRDVGLETRATVPWWAEHKRHPSSGHLLGHLIAETGRHAGHIDILREQLDGRVGYTEGNSNLPQREGIKSYSAKLEGLTRDVQRMEEAQQAAEALASGEAAGTTSPFWSQPTLTTERLTLEPTSWRDFEGVSAMHSDPAAARFMYNPVWTPETAERLFAGKLSETGRRSKQSWTARTKDGGEFVGRFILTLEEHQQCELGWSAAAPMRGRGYATEAVRAMMRHAFEAEGVHRATAAIDVENIPSQRVAEKVGLRRTALNEDSRLVEGEWRSHEIWSLINR